MQHPVLLVENRSYSMYPEAHQHLLSVINTGARADSAGTNFVAQIPCGSIVTSQRLAVYCMGLGGYGAQPPPFSFRRLRRQGVTREGRHHPLVTTVKHVQHDQATKPAIKSAFITHRAATFAI